MEIVCWGGRKMNEGMMLTFCWHLLGNAAAAAAAPVRPSSRHPRTNPRHGVGYVADHHEITSHYLGVLGGAGHGVAERHAQGEQQGAGRAPTKWERAIQEGQVGPGGTSENNSWGRFRLLQKDKGVGAA